MRQFIRYVVVFTWLTLPPIVHAGQSLLHPPSRGEKGSTVTAPSLEDSPEHPIYQEKRFYLGPSPRAKKGHRTEKLPSAFATRRKAEPERNAYTPPQRPEKFAFESFSQGEKCTGKLIDSGIASWYGNQFHGRRSASGSIYNQHDLTIAHKKWPFGLRVCIRNPQNNKEVVATVTDRGPYWENRKFDLSKRTAEELGVIEPGTAYVHVHRAIR